MARISVSLSGIERKLLNRLASADAEVTLHNLRLATGAKILAPRDNPSTFVALSSLQSQLSKMTATMANVTAASSIVRQTKTTVGQIRDQLDLIREVLTDEESNSDAAHRAAAQAAIDEAIDQINQLAKTPIDGRRILDGSADYQVSGGNVSQVSKLRIYSTPNEAPAIISGRVYQAATQAELAYTGSGGQTTAAAQVTLTGQRGAATITVALNEDLDEVAEKINDQSHETGVTASVDGDRLNLTSVDYGTHAQVAVTVGSGSFTTTGGHGDGTANGTDAVARINGVTYSGNSVAQTARLYHREATGLITNNATIRITGHVGFDDVTVTVGQTLAQVAENVNLATATTGIRAEVDGAELVLMSTNRGAEAQAHVEVRSGTFTLEDNYTAATQAELTYTGSGGQLTDAATFRLTGNDGFFDFNFADNTLLTDVRTAINAETGTTGVEAVVDGNTLYLRSSDTGEAALVTITNATGFTVTGGHGDGTANGTNAAATAEGQDAVTGRPNVDGNRFIVNDNGLRFEIEFASGFAGEFDTMSVDGRGLSFALFTNLNSISTLPIPSLQAASLGGISGQLSQIYSGGPYSGLDAQTSRSIRIVDEAIGDLDQVQGLVDGFYDAAVTSSSDLLTALQEELSESIKQTDGYNEDEEEMLLQKSEALASNAQASLSVFYEQRMSIVRLIQHVAGLD